MTNSSQYFQGPFIDETVYFPDEQGQLILKLTDNNRDIANAVNVREIGNYLQQEIVTGSILFSNASPSDTFPVFRKVINFGALPFPSPKPVPHGINFTDEFRMLKCWICATDPTAIEFIQFSFADPTTAQALSMRVTATNVVVTSNFDYSNFTSSIAVLEYVKRL